MRAKTKLIVKIFDFLSVFMVGAKYFIILKTGVDQRQKSSIELFDLHLSKSLSISEKTKPIVFFIKVMLTLFPKQNTFNSSQKNTLYVTFWIIFYNFLYL